MILSLSYQANLFITTLFWGFGLAFLYDLIRVARIAVKHGKFFVALEDILYWIAVSLTVFFVMLSESFGEVRVFCILGVFLGMFFYSFALSRLFLSISSFVINGVKKIISIIIEIIMTPFRLLMKLLYKPAKKVYNFAGKKYNKILQFFKVYAKIYIGRARRNKEAFMQKKALKKRKKKSKKNHASESTRTVRTVRMEPKDRPTEDKVKKRKQKKRAK